MGGLFKQYLWVVDLAACFLCAFFAAKITSLYISRLLEVEPAGLQFSESVSAAAVEESGSTPNDYKVIVERNIFDSSEVTVAESQAVEEIQTIQTGEAVKTSLGIKLFGVMVVGSGTDDRSSATVQGAGGKSAVDTYAVGDENGFAPNTKLIRVKPDRIEFLNSGRLEYALLEEEWGGNIFGAPLSILTSGGEAPKPAEKSDASGLIKQVSENRFVIDQKEVENALKNLDQLYTQIRAVPNFAGGKVSGMKILAVQPGSIFDKLGLKRGDVLERINGVELDVKQGFQIFAQLKDEKKFSLDLIRQGSNQTVEYEVR